MSMSAPWWSCRSLRCSQHGLADGLLVCGRPLTAPVAAAAIRLTLWTAALMAVVNAVMGTVTAWVLVRYEFPGRGLLSALVDLPFAIPTLVTGVMLVMLFGPQSALGGWLGGARYAGGIRPARHRAGPAVHHGALRGTGGGAGADGAGSGRGGGRPHPGRRHLHRVLAHPAAAHLPALLSGTIRSFARALGEFGSVIVVSGNIPHRTLTAPIYIFGEIESGQPDGPPRCRWCCSPWPWA